MITDFPESKMPQYFFDHRVGYFAFGPVSCGWNRQPESAIAKTYKDRRSQ